MNHDIKQAPEKLRQLRQFLAYEDCITLPKASIAKGGSNNDSLVSNWGWPVILVKYYVGFCRLSAGIALST